MDNEDLVLSTHNVRDMVLTSKLIDNKIITDHIVLNMLPVNKIEDIHVISDFTEFLDLDGILPYPKEMHDDIKEFLNVILTNVINRTFDMSLPGISIDSFFSDRKSLIEMARNDTEVQAVLDNIDFRTLLGEFANEKDVEEMYDESIHITYLVVKNKIKIVCVDKDVIPPNDDLDNGEIFKITNNIPLYGDLLRIDKTLIEGDYDYVIYSTNGKSYLVCKSVFKYKTIREFDISEYQLLNIKK